MTRARPHKQSAPKPESSTVIPDPVRQQQLLSFMLDHIGDEVMLIRSDGRIVYVNEATVRGLGYSSREILSRTITAFFPKRISVAQWQKTHFTMIKKSPRPVTLQLPRKVKSGAVQTIEVTAVYVVFENVEYILSIARNVTAKVRLEQELRETAHQYRLVCEGAGDGIVTSDLQGYITYANQAAEEMTEVPLAKARSMHFKDFVAKESLELAVECFRRALSGEDRIHEHVQVVGHKTGEHIPVDITVSPLKHNGKIIHIQAILHDTSKRRRIEDLQRESERYKTLFNFIAGVSQEIYAPLQTIHRQAERIVEKYEDREFEYISFKEFKDIMATIGRINEQVRYCCETTERLINLNQKKVNIKRRQSRVNQVIEEAVERLSQSIAAANVKIKLMLAPSLPEAAIGPIELNQVVSNLISNALQAMPAGGTVKVRTKFNKRENMIAVSFQDEGVGIPRQHLPHIFEPFFTTKGRGVEKSSGMGLAIVYSLIKACNGDISVESSLRRGTVIGLLLPVKSSSASGRKAPKGRRPGR